MDEEHWIYLDESKKEGVSVVLMDAFHCPGAVMFLFRGKMGTVLHTGDFRFSENMFDNPFLFPEERRTKDMRGISIDVDYLFLDNTFADPTTDFPSREEAYKGMVDIIKNHSNYRIFAFSYNLGKEEVFMNLAEEFETLVSFKYWQ
jgi:DNA cross-link repair 1B protein